MSLDGRSLPSTTLPVEIDDDHVLGPHHVVGDAAGLDHDVLAVVADAADVAPGERDQAMRDQIEIRLANLFFELFEHAAITCPSRTSV